MLLSGYAGGYGMATCALRFTNVYGPGMARKDSFVPRIMRAVRAGRPVQVYGTGGQRRDLGHVADVVARVVGPWRAGPVRPLLVGAGRAVSVLGLIQAAGEVVRAPAQVGHVAAKPGGMRAEVGALA